MIYLLGDWPEIRIEKCLAGNDRAPVDHLIQDIQLHAVPPLVQFKRHTRLHFREIGVNHSPVEGRLHDPRLAFVKLTFAGQQPVADDLLAQLQWPSLDKFVLVCRQYIADQVRMVEQCNTGWPD